MDKSGYRMETLAVHSGERRPGPEGSVVFPIFQGTVYSFEPGTDYHDIRYIRLKHLRKLLESGELDEQLRWRRAPA